MPYITQDVREGSLRHVSHWALEAALSSLTASAWAWTTSYLLSTIPWAAVSAWIAVLVAARLHSR